MKADVRPWTHIAEAVRRVDRELRERSVCSHCGKPRDGFQRVDPGTMRRTRDAEGYDHITGAPVSRKAAGLCTCCSVAFQNRELGTSAAEVFPDRAAADAMLRECAGNKLQPGTGIEADTDSIDWRTSDGTLVATLVVTDLWRKYDSEENSGD